jgi:hypothetical protein
MSYSLPGLNAAGPAAIHSWFRTSAILALPDSKIHVILRFASSSLKWRVGRGST